jgi:hypothetical protein
MQGRVPSGLRLPVTSVVEPTCHTSPTAGTSDYDDGPTGGGVTRISRQARPDGWTGKHTREPSFVRRSPQCQRSHNARINTKTQYPVFPGSTPPRRPKYRRLCDLDSRGSTLRPSIQANSNSSLCTPKSQMSASLEHDRRRWVASGRRTARAQRPLRFILATLEGQGRRT